MQKKTVAYGVYVVKCDSCQEELEQCDNIYCKNSLLDNKEIFCIFRGDKQRNEHYCSRKCEKKSGKGLYARIQIEKSKRPKEEVRP